MAPHDPLEDLSEAEKDYHESSDEDFNPTAAPADESASSSDEDDAAATAAKAKGKGKGKGKGKRKAPADDGLDSGDEVTIEQIRKRKAKKRKGQKDDDDELILSDDEGGEGGLVKTRAQRRVEQKERRPLARTDGATIDVDALWAQMSTALLRPAPPAKPQDTNTHKATDEAPAAATSDAVEEEQVTVTKVYTFAGQRTTEEKQIPRSALEKHTADGWKAVEPVIEKPAIHANDSEAKNDLPKIRRPLRRPSRFDPNPTGFVRALAPEHQLTWPRKTGPIAAAEQENAPAIETAKARPEKAQKLNVVDKSRLDWTGFVDKEGIAEELDTHGKTKEAYLGRMDFLAGVEARREEERKKMKTAAAS
ncbi:BCNT-domain-containing protein [Lentithecium fluviatile CBS 122367]|uniref:SWR1-complex protein 5 n=1 Tax=Lentithecium fluviatile CBS 122367 TaxID=1168545 RepID=A0A6G1IIH2_9PLEO|nr:BCNT-domain-containing protein [Lentithecium fluviatile CBS 122367]